MGSGWKWFSRVDCRVLLLVVLKNYADCYHLGYLICLDSKLMYSEHVHLYVCMYEYMLNIYPLKFIHVWIM
jgi:hypothetical protein